MLLSNILALEAGLCRIAAGLLGAAALVDIQNGGSSAASSDDTCQLLVLHLVDHGCSTLQLCLLAHQISNAFGQKRSTNYPHT